MSDACCMRLQHLFIACSHFHLCQAPLSDVRGWATADWQCSVLEDFWPLSLSFPLLLWTTDLQSQNSATLLLVGQCVPARACIFGCTFIGCVYVGRRSLTEEWRRGSKRQPRGTKVAGPPHCPPPLLLASLARSRCNIEDGRWPVAFIFDLIASISCSSS